jgi:hypothetical protein
MFCPTLISVRLAPSIFVDDIGERDTANRPKASHGIADRKQGIRVEAEARRKAHNGFCFLLELQIQRRQGRAEAGRSRRQQHVLHRWIDRRAGRAARGGSFEAGDDSHGGFMDVRGQIFYRVEETEKALPAHARGRFTGSIPRCDLLVLCTLVVGPDSLLDRFVLHHEEPPPLHTITTPSLFN